MCLISTAVQISEESCNGLAAENLQSESGVGRSRRKGDLTKIQFPREPSFTSFMWWTSNADGQNVCSHANKNNCNVSFLNFCLPIKSFRNENL